MSQTIGTNVSMKMEGSKLVLTIDLSERHGRSASGKSTIVAKTNGGAFPVAYDGKVVSLNLQAYTKE